MNITKYEHACFTVEQDGKLLIVDPGAFTTDIGAPENVVGIVVTHEHADHFDPAALGAIIAHNPDAVIVAHENITRQFGDQNETLPYNTVGTGDKVSVGPFELEFFGGDHAIIHPDIPQIANLGVMINNTVFYPGDSFVRPERDVHVLALPVSAPWLKISEVIEYLMDVKPKIAFPTHDAIASPAGKSLPDRMIPPFAENVGASYKRIDDAPLSV